MQTQLQRSKHDPTETRCKLTLLILFLLGAALILGGLWGIRQYQQSGFDQEVGYRYIQKLSGEVDRLYTQSIQPVMAKLTDAEREALTLQAAGLLKENWTAAVKADQSARADEMLSGLTGDKLQQKTMELLSITYSLNGPRWLPPKRSSWLSGRTRSAARTGKPCFGPCWMKARPCRRPWLPPWAS